MDIGFPELKKYWGVTTEGEKTDQIIRTISCWDRYEDELRIARYEAFFRSTLNQQFIIVFFACTFQVFFTILLCRINTQAYFLGYSTGILYACTLQLNLKSIPTQTFFISLSLNPYFYTRCACWSWIRYSIRSLLQSSRKYSTRWNLEGF